MSTELSLESINACLLMQQKDLACNKILFDFNTGLFLEREKENQKNTVDNILHIIKNEKRSLEEQRKQKNNNKEYTEGSFNKAIQQVSAKQEKYYKIEKEVQKAAESCEAQKSYIQNVESDLVRVGKTIQEIESRESILKILENKTKWLEEQLNQKNSHKEEVKQKLNKAIKRVSAKEQEYKNADNEWRQAVESYETKKNDLQNVESDLSKIRNKIKNTCRCTWWEWDELIEKKEALKRDLKQATEELNQRESDKHHKENIKTQAHDELQKQIKEKSRIDALKKQAYEDLRTLENDPERSKTDKALDAEKQNQKRKGSLGQEAEGLKKNLDLGKTELTRRESDKHHKENIKIKTHAELQTQIELKNQAEELKKQAEADLKTFDNHPIRIQVLEQEEKLAKQKFVDAHELLNQLRSQINEIGNNEQEDLSDLYHENEINTNLMGDFIEEQEHVL